jgi:ATP-dependent DNA helicase RecG
VKRAAKAARGRASAVSKRTRPLPLAATGQSAAPASRLTPHASLQFVTPAVAERLAKLGITRLSELVLHLPLRYEDETRITPIHDALSGDTVQVEGTVVSTEVKFRPGRQLISEVDDGSGRLTMRFFNFYESQRRASSAPRWSIRASRCCAARRRCRRR